MRKFFVLLLGIALLSISGVSAQILSEDFTASLNGWVVVDTLGTAGNWAWSANTVHPSGIAPPNAGLAYFNAWSASTGNNTRLYNPSNLDFSGMNNVQVDFQMYHDIGYTTNDRVQVQYSSDGGTTWSNVGAAVPRYTGAVGWANHSVNAAVTGTSTVRIGFEGISAYGNDCHIDEVRVYASGVTTYTLTMLAPGGMGTGTVSPVAGAYVYAENTVAAISASPAFGSVFDYWEVDGAFYSTNASDTILMDADYDVQAFFDVLAAAPLPVCENFDGTWSGTPPAPAGWLVINSDADAYTWRQGNNYITPTHSVPYAAVGMGCNNDWMISPAIDIPVGVNAEIVWWDRVESASYPNVYDVLISTTGYGIGDFTVLANYNCINVPWTEHVLSLSAYAGNTVYIAFHQTFSQATFYGFGIDDVCIQEAPIYWNLTMDAPVGNGTVSPAAGVYPYAQGTIVDVVASPDCGYVFSNWIGNVADPNAASTTITMDADYTIQAVFTASGTVFLSEGFETGATGWTYYDADGDTFLWNVICGATTSPHTGTCNATSASFQGVALTPDNWMVSPQVNLTSASDAVISWYVAAQDQAWPSEYYDVLVSTGGNAIVDFTNVVHSETVLAAGPDGNNYWLRSVDLTPFVGGNIYVAFRHYNSIDWFRINIDDVCITGTEVIPTATPTTEPPTATPTTEPPTATPTTEPPTATPTGPTPTPVVEVIPTTGPAGIGLLLLAIGALMSFAGLRRK